MEKKTIKKGHLRNALCKECLELNEYGEVLLAKNFLFTCKENSFWLFFASAILYPHIFQFGIPVASECP